MFEELEVLNTEEAHLEDELCDLNHILEVRFYLSLCVFGFSVAGGCTARQ